MQAAYADSSVGWSGSVTVHVASVGASIRFYADRLGFTVPWRHEEDGQVRIAQVWPNADVVGS
jgi:hypothetical protein